MLNPEKMSQQSSLNQLDSVYEPRKLEALRRQTRNRAS